MSRRARSPSVECSDEIVGDSRPCALGRAGGRRVRSTPSSSAITRSSTATAGRSSSDPDDAQDALQATMAAALRALPGERREIKLRPWLFRVAHNEAISIARTGTGGAAGQRAVARAGGRRGRRGPRAASPARRRPERPARAPAGGARDAGAEWPLLRGHSRRAGRIGGGGAPARLRGEGSHA